MLRRRLIPKLLIRRSRAGIGMVLVTTIRFRECLEVGDPVSQAKIYEAQAADELLILDIDAQREGRATDLAVIRRAADETLMPLTVGGGVRSLDDFRELLRNGADKVSVNTAALEDPDLIDRAADAFGTQCVVLAIDFTRSADGSHAVWSRGGRQRTAWDPVRWAVEGTRRGAGEILLTSIDRDGTRSGLDVDLTRRIADSVGVPVIAAGGCGVAAHFVEGFVAGRADAVAAGTFFCFEDQNPMQTRAHVHNAGIPIRLAT